jgi:hypothetical protein
MILLKTCLFLMTLLSCSNNVSSDNVVVIGKAENAKAGATVISKDDKKIYYVDGLDYWSEKVIGKTVKVSGKLLIENKPEQNPNEPISQQITGEKRIILKPKWELTK